MISFKGYQTLIGLLKWAMPLDSKKSLSVTVQTLCNLVLQQIKDTQSPHHIAYRTRHMTDSGSKCDYPFDSHSFRRKAQQMQDSMSSDSKGLTKADNLIRAVQLTHQNPKTQ